MRRPALLLTALLLAALAPGAAAKVPAPVSVRGNHLVAGGHIVRLIGVDRAGSEYSCTGDDGQGGKGYGIFSGPTDDQAVRTMLTWKIRAVALPLNEACWLGGYGGLKKQYSGRAYRDAIAGYVRRLNAHGLYVVLRLSGAAPGRHTFGSDKGDSDIPMPDADHALAFWRSVAQRFRSDRAVLFHAYDEPHDVSWRCALHGCRAFAGRSGDPKYGSYQATGHQQIVNAIRHQGARQPIIVSGIDFASDLTKWERYAPRDPRHQLVADTSQFDFANTLGKKGRATLRSLARRHPIVVGGFGDTDCNSDFSRRLMAFADSIGMSYLAWTWNTTADFGGCENALLGPGLGAYRTGHPTGYGRGVRDHFRALARRR